MHSGTRRLEVLRGGSSPGSGKTSLLERTLEAFPDDMHVAVLTGDIQTENDARRLARFGFPVRQITTGGTCHLDARMVEKHLADRASGCRRMDAFLASPGQVPRLPPSGRQTVRNPRWSLPRTPFMDPK